MDNKKRNEKILQLTCDFLAQINFEVEKRSVGSKGSTFSEDAPLGPGDPPDFAIDGLGGPEGDARADGG